MTYVTTARSRRTWAAVAVAALATMTLVTAPTVARAATASTVAADPAGTVVAPSSTVVLTGRAELTDDAVYSETDDGVVTLPRDGSATDWAPVVVAGSQLSGHLLQAEGESLLVANLDGASDTLAWRADDGSWSSRSVPNGTTLGRGGLYALLPSGPGSDGQVNWPIEEVTSGAVVVRSQRDWVAGMAIDGSTVWARAPYGETINQYALPAGTVLRVAPEPTFAPGDELSVSGRWALATGGNTSVIDLDGVYTDLLVGSSSALRHPAVGSRAVAWLTSSWTVMTRELTGARTTRTVGAAGSADLDLDDRGSTLAYVDRTHHVRLVDLGWAAAPGATIVDHTPPPVPALSWNGHRSVTSTVLSVTTSAGTDAGTAPYRPSGLGDVEIRYHQHTIGVSTFGPWIAGDSWRLDLVVARGTTTCFQARSRDGAGNYSAWSSTLCGSVDGTAPHLTVHGPATSTKAVNGKATVPFTYEATDDTRVQDYDVRYKKAPRGSTSYGSWVYPSSWQGTTAWSRSAPRPGVSVTITTGQRVCLSVRARDIAGNVTPWSSARCTFADGTKPRLTRLTGPSGWQPVSSTGKRTSTIRFAGTDDHGLRFDVRYNVAGATGKLPGWKTVAYKTAATHYSFTLRSGWEGCYEVRAHDLAGNVSAWSAVRCTRLAAPATVGPFKAAKHTTVGGVRVAVPGATIWAHDGIRGIQLQVRTCPTCDSFRVQVTDRMYTINTRSRNSGWKTVTLRWPLSANVLGEIDLYPPSSKHAYVRSWVLVRH
ncbi:hypothetical protein ACFT5B_18615 [Luteimicrobium sp. NPDC057192]|uniref:hypothetical protein n=1 Tax=Luteimicrobium sp. NPDC057192 TaxID=3346042 RepID=UPI00362F9FD8